MSWEIWTSYQMLDDQSQPASCYKGKRSRFRECSERCTTDTCLLKYQLDDPGYKDQFGDACDSNEAKNHIDFVDEASPKEGKQYEWQTHSEYDTDEILSCCMFWYSQL